MKIDAHIGGYTPLSTTFDIFMLDITLVPPVVNTINYKVRAAQIEPSLGKFTFTADPNNVPANFFGSVDMFILCKVCGINL